MARFEKSFYEWCLENNHEDYLELWDYELNSCSPKDIAYGTRKKCWFKCFRGIHESEQKRIDVIVRDGLLRCNQCNSFGQWLIDTYGKEALELYWDYNKNETNPFEITKRSTVKVWIKCQDVDYHKSYEISCDNFYRGRRCSYCSSRKIHPKDSFGQLLIDEYGSLEVIWDFEKNGALDPFSLAKQANQKVWLFCQEKDYHGSYEVFCYSFISGNRCPYCCCSHGLVHPRDSFGQKLIDNYGVDAIEKMWSKKNTLDPFKIAPCSAKKIWIICQNDENHEDYEIACEKFTNGRRCPECKESKGEKEVRKYLNANNINFLPQKIFLNLLGINNGNLRYDFYLPEYNLLIEYQGEFHDGTAYQQTEEEFLIQQEHDRRKKEYAKSHNIKLLEIWYWDFDNITEILNKELGLS